MTLDRRRHTKACVFSDLGSLRGPATPWRLPFLPFLLALSVAEVAACRRTESTAEVKASDGGVVERARIEAPDLRFSLTLAPNWRVSTIRTLDRSGRVKTIGEARRDPGEKTYLLVPRLIVTQEPARVSNLEAVAQIVMSDLAQIAAQPGAKLNRTVLGHRFIGAKEVATVDIGFSVSAPGQVARPVLQRSVVAVIEGPSGKPTLLTVTATYMAEDEAAVASEVQTMFSSLDFATATVRK